MPLREVLALLEAGRGEAALEAALVRWRLDPHPRLGDLVDELSSRVREAPRGDLAGASETVQQIWLARAAAAGAAQLPALLETIAGTNMHAARARIAVLARRPADPRIEGALVGLLEAVPFEHKQSRPLWADLFAILQGARDPRILARLERLDGRIAGGDRTRMIRGRLRQQVAELLAVLRPRLGGAGLIAHEHAAIDEVLAAVRARPRGHLAPAPLPAPAAAAPVPAIRDALLEAIYASPDDDGPRMVFADAMIERGDPRGDFVALQLRQDPGPVARRREKELLASHRRAWLGELAPIVRRCEFERGFLASVEVIPNDRELVRRLAGHPSWATVHTLSGSSVIALHPVMRSLRTLAFDAHAAAAIEGQPAAWEELLLGDARPIETLRYTTALGADREYHALASCRALPRLRVLAAHAPRTTDVRALRAWADTLLHGAAARRIGELELVFTRDAERPFALVDGLLEPATAPTLRLVTDGLACTLTATGGRYLAVHVALTEQVGPSVAAIVQAIETLPTSVRDVTVEASRISPTSRVTIDAAVVRRGGHCRFV